MDQFIKIPRCFLKLNSNTKFIDVLIYAILDNYRDGANNKTRIGIRTISDKYKIAVSKIEDAIKRLKAAGYIDISQIKSSNNQYVFNEYTFPHLKEDFLMLSPDILIQDLKPKEKGFLIYLQLLALPLMREVEYTKIEDIAKSLNVTRQTASKYLSRFLEINQISKKRDFYLCKYGKL